MRPAYLAVLLVPAIACLVLLLIPATALGQCSNTSYGNGATCIQAAGATGGGCASGCTSNTLSFPPAAGHAVIVATYACGNSACTGSTTGFTETISDNVNNPEACFVKSPGSPFNLVETSSGAERLQQYMWVCPSIPSGVTSITVRSSSTSYYLTFSASEWTGLASSNVWDADGGNASTTQGETATLSTSSPLSYYHDLMYTFLDNTGDETMTPVSPYLQVTQFYSGNIDTAITVNTAGVQTAQTTWTPNDDWYGVIGAIKTAASTGTVTVFPPATLSASVQ